nr:helix-turn-helix transcriptional regulator [uncultured Noviherbaspirillum sp.]
MRTVQPTAFPADPFVSSADVLARAIRAARTQARVTVSDAALVSNVSIQTLVDVEAGRPGVSIGKILQIADALGVSLFVAPASQREEMRNQLRSAAAPETGK